MRRAGQLILTLVAGMALLAVVGSTQSSLSAEEAVDPWETLGRLRGNLAANPQQAAFVQEYRPAGFSSGDRERGDLYLAIPECVRWDYRDPYPKSFLLCGTEIHTWNPGDTAGRRFTLSDSDGPGLDLLRLRLEELQQRYGATVEIDQQGSTVVVLTPRSPTFVIAEARLTVAPRATHLLALSYSDQDGNLSRFEISGYQDLLARELFEPPAELEWIEE